MEEEITLNFLDHVALRVADPERSVEWYGEVLGLQAHRLPEWGDFPIFLLAGKCGVALFPATGPGLDPTTKAVKVDHFAFNVDQDNFARARARYEQLGLVHHVRDHHYYHSLYTRDPDGHLVELTTLVAAEPPF
ncbi:MAG: VOC family protein [Bacteroidota bacterium]